jgi:hypothetical protein
MRKGKVWGHLVPENGEGKLCSVLIDERRACRFGAVNTYIENLSFLRKLFASWEHFQAAAPAR